MREPPAHGRVQVSRRVQLSRVAFAEPNARRASSRFRAAITRKASRWRRKLLGIPATIVMPSDAPAVKLDATREYGARSRALRTRALASRRDRARRRRRARARRWFRRSTIRASSPAPAPPRWSCWKMPADLDAIVVARGRRRTHGRNGDRRARPRSGDRDLRRRARGGRRFRASLERGERVSIGVPSTIADGLQTTAPAELTLRDRARAWAFVVVTVSDDGAVARRCALRSNG